jgi:hypothetical protein
MIFFFFLVIVSENLKPSEDTTLYLSLLTPITSIVPGIEVPNKHLLNETKLCGHRVITTPDFGKE